MEIIQIFAFLTRPAALIAAFAGFIVLSIAFIAIRRAKRRRDARVAAMQRARRLVGKMRHCPRFNKSEDRRLAVRIVEELTAVAAEHDFPLHEVGTSRSEIDKILHLVREDVVADPRSRWPNALRRVLNPKEPGTPAIPINAECPVDCAGGQVLFCATFSADEFSPSSRTEPPTNPSEQGTVEIIVEAPEEPEQTHSADPLVALRSMDEDAIDDFIDARFLAIQVKDEN